MSAAARTVGRYVVEALAANGIDTVFGIPGVHNIELYRGLESGQPRHVLVRHEQNAGFAADGFARLSGRPAAAFVISGPGLTNILTPMAQAYSDSVPLLVIASTPVRASLGQRWGVLHELADQRALAAGVAGFAGSARAEADLPGLLRAAFETLRAPRPRPAYVEIPRDLLAADTALQPGRLNAPRYDAEPDAGDVARAVQLLEAAARPLIVAGGGARGAVRELAALADALDAYLVTTVAGKGILADGHPAALGAGLPYAPVQALVREADVVLAVGTELAETDLYTSTHLSLAGGSLIRIDVDAGSLAGLPAAQVRVQADAARAIAAIGARVTPRRGWRTTRGPAAGVRAAIAAGFGPKTRSLAALLNVMRAALPGDAAIFTDMTQAAYLGNYAFPVDRPGCWFHPCGYGTLGFALPAAIGAKVAAPARTVV
ncbi:MAG TPA: thiamine pyrophosphate-binding protein, partial [Steroidobacteraceae bacterium]|nr:thiamine pyrophosphate-binding protein [Steroidobacteraceae bacterium]